MTARNAQRALAAAALGAVLALSSVGQLSAQAAAPAYPAVASSVQAMAAATVQPTAEAAVAQPAVASAGVPAVSSSAANARLATVLPERSRSAALGSFTLTVWDPGAGQWVFQQRAGQSIRGASTTKILTAVAALETMGPTHRFPTKVTRGSSSKEIVLVAGGDPLLTSKDLKTLAQRTASALKKGTGSGKKRKLRSINVRADDSLFTGSDRAEGWARGWVPGDVRAVSAFARDDRAVSNATADAGRSFAAALRKQGVKATYRGERKSRSRTAIASIPGHSVGQAVARALSISENDTAEMLFRHVAIARGQRADWAGAQRAVAATLRDLGIPLAGARIVDGSGLSMSGRVTADELTAALSVALSPAHPRLSGLRSWLPVAGRSGTLSPAYQRFTAKPASCAAGLIQAKTGTLAETIALAGYARAADGGTRVFVAIVNDRPARYSRDTTRRAVDKVTSSITGCW